ncbi:MAG: hypothetical protein JNK15_23755 [Planctomycetes bacterium]|nr:hypothetical protein [Planctomycetota bacterium]
MVLLGRFSSLLKSPGRLFCGVTSTLPGNWNNPGAVRNRWVGWAGLNKTLAHPVGYNPEYSIYDAPSSGGIASTGLVVGDGGVTSGNLAGGLNGDAALVGTGDITNAACGLIVSAVAALVGSGSISASMVASLQAVAGLAGSGDLTGSLGALAGLAASLAGSGATSATAGASGSMQAGIVVTGDLLNTANVGSAVWASLLEGSYSAADILRILAAIAAGKTDITGSTVTFRDLNDIADRVVAAMTGSERTSVAIDPD